MADVHAGLPAPLRPRDRAANAVASDLGVQSVEPIDSDSSALADGADVVVIAGEDRAQL